MRDTAEAFLAMSYSRPLSSPRCNLFGISVYSVACFEAMLGSFDVREVFKWRVHGSLSSPSLSFASP